MASVTIPAFCLRMRISFNFPREDPVAGPAVCAEKLFVGIIMAHGTRQGFIEHGVVHFRDICRMTEMFAMAGKAMCLRGVKTDAGVQFIRLIEIVAFQAHLVRHALPGNMAGFAVGDVGVHGAQSPWLRGFFVSIKPRGQSDDCRKDKSVQQFRFQGSHRSP